MGLWSPSAHASAILAAAEINQVGGILGREIELIFKDAGATASSAVAAAREAVEVQEAHAVVALICSKARAPVSRALSGRVPYIYTPQFEGNERDADVVTIGETSEELLRPAVDWLTETKSVKRFYVVGNDYLWPRATCVLAKRIISSSGGTSVGESFLPFGQQDYEQVFADLRARKADVVMSFLLGNEAIAFNRAFSEAGLSRSILRFSPAIDETILYAIGADHTENLFVTSGYFSAVRSSHNDGYLERYYTAFGEGGPPPNGFGESCYEGLHCLAALSASAGGLRPHDVRRRQGRALQAQTARGGGRQTIAGGSRPVYLAEAEGLGFRLLSSR